MADVKGWHVVDDLYRHASNFGKGTGYESRDYDRYPIAGLKCARKSTRKAISDRKLQREMIADKTARHAWIKDKCDLAGLPRKDQSQSNYCWFHAPVHGAECKRVLQGGSKLILSAFYGAALIKGGRNQGGSGIEAVEWMAEHGTCVESMHPPMDFSTRNSDEAKANAMLHQITDYEEFDPDDTDAIITAILFDDAVTVGIPSWGHEVLLTFLVDEGGEILFGFDNSWGMDWGTQGRGVLRGSKSRFDEAGSIASMEASVA